MGQGKRVYDATARRRRAEDRKAEVVEAAAAVFADKGFEKTTLADVAEAAGVSVPYLQKQGSKTDLFVLAIERITVGPQQRTVEQSRADLEGMMATMTRDELIESTVDFTAEWNRRSFGMWRAWASTSDPELRQRWERLMTEIRATWAGFLAPFDERGWWRTDIPRSEQVAAVWLLTMAETYERMTVVAGLSHEEYVSWLRRSMTDVLVGCGVGSPAAPGA